jgi:hypothetical protein
MMRCRLFAGALLISVVGDAGAQSLGTFRWQLQPYCNVVTVAITQNGAVYRLEGTDDQCGGGGDKASVTGTAFPNADGTIGFGLNIVTTPGGRPLHVDAEINLGTFGGTWRDSAGATGTFVLTPGAGTGGAARPLPPPPAAVPSAIALQPDGGFVAGSVGPAVIPASGPGRRMMWHPGKSAFRAGQVDGTQWDDANVGSHSAALGFNTRARGAFSTALGSGTTASGLGSTAMGLNTTASGQASTAMGAATTASGFNTTAMGRDSVASGDEAVAAGRSVTASGPQSTAMGLNTTASGPASTAMGAATTASGFNTTAMGRDSVAAGDEAVAAGRSVTANGAGSVVLGSFAAARSFQPGSFVFGDRSSTTEVVAGSANVFGVRAAGGAFFFSNAAMTLGVQLSPSGTQWSSLSDARSKHDFRTLDGETVLAKLARMPVQEWSYVAQDPAIRHIGPTAQDFHAAFGLGEDPLRIGTLDADGVALASVKALEARSRAQAERIDALERRLAEALAALGAATNACR